MSQSLTQIYDDVYQVALPLPFALKIINAYLVRGDDGWTIIDTGLNTSLARATWQTALDELEIQAGAVSQIVLTHTHPDHFGLAGWLQDKFSTPAGFVTPVKMSSRELATTNLVWGNLESWAQASMPFWAQCGIEERVATAVSESTVQTGQRTRPHPTQIETIEAGDSLKIGNRTCKMMLMPGHADGQLVFYDETERLLFCGDHVLEKITPNISLWPYGNPDPLDDYLQSFHTLRTLKIDKALPGHGPLIDDLHKRIDEIEQHHEERLDVVLTAVNRPLTPYEVSAALFNQDKLSIHETRFAVTESLAHLEYLRIRGKLERLGTVTWKYRPTF